jgi:hypothetical protein
MSKKLRLYRERKTDLAVEVDLRGLGDDIFAEDLQPRIYLQLAHSQGFDPSPYATNHGLKMSRIDDNQVIFEATEAHYKANTVVLFVTALKIMTEHPKDSCLMLAELDLLREQLLRNIGENIFTRVSDLQPGNFQVRKIPNAITISPLCQLILNEAGLPIAVIEADQQLDQKFTEEFLKNFHQQTQIMKKIG